MEKFQQNIEFKDFLMKTGKAEIIEHTARDKFWGDGGKNGKGENMLG